MVITGGQGDIGQALAAAFQAAGYEALAPGRGELDVTRPEAVDAFFKGLGHLDGLVYNAGLAEDALAGKVDPLSWQRQLDVNLRGAFLCARAAIPLLESSPAGGQFIGIGSWSGLVGNAGQSAYAAAKAGLTGLTLSLARELGPRNIRANCVLPGLMKTRMTRHLAESAWENARGAHVLGRFNEPTEAARFVVFLDSLPHTSGQVFQLDSRIAPWC
jgi:3-oxoacyl-[acyl-carrier protein] reductase